MSEMRERKTLLRRLGRRFKNAVFPEQDISQGDIGLAQQAIDFANSNVPSVNKINDRIVYTPDAATDVNMLLEIAKPKANRFSRRRAARLLGAAGAGVAATELYHVLTDNTQVLKEQVQRLSESLRGTEQEKNRVAGEYGEYRRRTEEDFRLLRVVVNEANERALLEKERADRLEPKANKFDQKTAAALREEEQLVLKGRSPSSFNDWYIEEIPEAEWSLYSTSGDSLFSSLSETTEIIFRDNSIPGRIGGAINSERTQANTGIYWNKRIDSNLDEAPMITVITKRGTGGPLEGNKYVFTPGKRRLLKFGHKSGRIEYLELLNPDPNDPTNSPKAILQKRT
jgi:hypothetical protein